MFFCYMFAILGIGGQAGLEPGREPGRFSGGFQCFL